MKKTAKKTAKTPAVSISYGQDKMTGFTQCAYWILNDQPVWKLKEQLRALKIGIPKTKDEMVRRIHGAAEGGPVRVEFALKIG
jgi:hypothetical protein